MCLFYRVPFSYTAPTRLLRIYRILRIFRGCINISSNSLLINLSDRLDIRLVSDKLASDWGKYMVKLITPAEAVALFRNNQTVMVGGFLNCGSPELVIDELLKTDLSGFTLIANDTGVADANRGKLVYAGKIKKAIVSHIGTNPETVRLYNEGKIEIDLQPQGSLAERVRAGGAGLGGVLTPVGVGTEVAKDKQIIAVNGKDYLLETPLHADIALVYATYADRFGNLSFHGSTRNFNALMPAAADVVIAEVEHISDEPLNPDHIAVPGIYVDYLIDGGRDGTL